MIFQENFFLVPHEFPRAVLTKNHKLSGLKQQKFIRSQFWRPEVQNQGVDRAGLSQKEKGGSFLHLPASGGQDFLGLWLQNNNLCLCLYMAFSVSSLALMRTLVIGFRAQVVQDILKIFNSTTSVCKDPFFQIRSQSQVPEYRHIFWGALFSSFSAFALRVP